MRYAELELALLTYWKEHGVKYLYKYKHRVKEYRGENLVSLELFMDMTSGGMFRDIEDIANDPEMSGKEATVAVDDLIRIRQEVLSSAE